MEQYMNEEDPLVDSKVGSEPKALQMVQFFFGIISPMVVTREKWFDRTLEEHFY